MDKPTTPAGPDSTPRPEDSGSEQDFGATGVFGVVKAPEPAKRPEPGWGSAPDDLGNRGNELPKPQPVPPPAQPPNLLSEPVVHKVVFGGGAAENSTGLLDRMRMASAERPPVQEKAQAPEPPVAKAPISQDPPAGAGGSGGFTQLLRTLEMDLPSQASAPAQIPASQAQRPVPESGLTGLLQTLGTPASAPPPENPMGAKQSVVPSNQEEPWKAPAAPGSGGFTELFRAMPAGGAESGGAPIQAPAASTPGTFTQLFGTLEGAGTPPPSEPQGQRTGDSSGSGPGSFTQMLSLERQSGPATAPLAADPYYEERKPSPGSLDYGLTPQTPAPTPSRDPFAPSPLPEAQPFQSAPPASGVGITRLIRMLDEPSAPQSAPVEAAPASLPRGTEPGIWTQTFASLAEPEHPPAPASRAPEWTPPPAPPPAPPVSASTPAGSSAGPSEFTRILDASRMREMAIKGSQPPSAPPPPQSPPAQSFAPPPPVPTPSYPAPVQPPMGGMPGYSGMPHQGGFPPPQAPGMYAPAPPPMPAPPPAAPMTPAQPAVGKLQQMVPVLLIVAIVLLVALLVTVIFLMKH